MGGGRGGGWVVGHLMGREGHLVGLVVLGALQDFGQ